MYDLMIRLTHECNMNCSFCHIKQEMKDKSTNDDLAKIVENFIRQNEHIGFEHFSISGGEPFLHIQKMQDILDVILSYDNNVPISIMSNGTYISSHIVNALNEFENIRVVVSLSGINKPEKSLQAMIKASPFGFGLIQNIKNLKRLCLRVVVDKYHDELATELLALHSIFNCKIELALNYEKAHELSLKDALAISLFIQRLKALGIKDSINFNNFFDRRCDCTNSKIITPNGKIEHKAHKRSNDYESYGCSNMTNAMGDELYEIFVRLIKAA